MTSTNRERGGSFRELKAHLPMFGDAAHRHDRGWPHPSPQGGDKANRESRWKTAGIFHFRHDDEDEG